MELLNIDGLRKSRRTIVVKRNTVNDILNIVFGTPWMERPIRFQKPTRLHVHQIHDRAVGRRRRAIFQRLMRNVLRGLTRIEERLDSVHFDGRA